MFNNSSVEVKSPIGTATSFKSGNSQQAGPNHDEIIVSTFCLISIVFPNETRKSSKTIFILAN